MINGSLERWSTRRRNDDHNAFGNVIIEPWQTWSPVCCKHDQVACNAFAQCYPQARRRRLHEQGESGVFYGVDAEFVLQNRRKHDHVWAFWVWFSVLFRRSVPGRMKVGIFCAYSKWHLPYFVTLCTCVRHGSMIKPALLYLHWLRWPPISPVLACRLCVIRSINPYPSCILRNFSPFYHASVSLFARWWVIPTSLDHWSVSVGSGTARIYRQNCLDHRCWSARLASETWSREIGQTLMILA